MNSDTRHLICNELLAVLGTGTQIEPFSMRCPDFTLLEANEVEDRTKSLRAKRGELPLGRKIGFT